MFNSVFSRRKVQRKIYNFTQSRRAQSPPSPASFASPDVHEKDSLHSNEHSFAFSDTSLNSKTGPSPQVQLNFENRGSISEWFPTELLRAESSTLSPPERNVSLPMGYTSHNASGSTSRFGGSSREALNFSRESIIIIEPEVCGLCFLSAAILTVSNQRNPPPPTPEPEITVPEIHEPEPQPQPEPQPEPEQIREPVSLDCSPEWTNQTNHLSSHHHEGLRRHQSRSPRIPFLRRSQSRGRRLRVPQQGLEISSPWDFTYLPGLPREQNQHAQTNHLPPFQGLPLPVLLFRARTSSLVRPETHGFAMGLHDRIQQRCQGENTLS